jgi:hypothetical protein
MPSGEKSEVTVMNSVAVVVEGMVQPDGTLEVTQKVDLPAGRVQVTVQPVADTIQPDRFWTMMESIWAAQLAGGRTARTREDSGKDTHCRVGSPRRIIQVLSRNRLGINYL